MTKTKNQNGFAHLGLLLMFLAVIGVIGVAGYTVGVNQNLKRETAARQAADAKADEEAKKLAQLKVKEIEAQRADDKPVEVVAQSEIKPVAPLAPKPALVPAPKPAPKPKPVYIHFSGVSSNFVSPTLNVTATLPQAYSGKCKIYMTQGATTYKKYVEISNSNTCNVSVNTSELPAAGNWEWYMYFWTHDGITNASSSPYTQAF